MTKILSDRIAVYLLIGGLLFRIIIALGLYPGYDEAYYYVYSHNLDWSYFDKIEMQPRKRTRPEEVQIYES
ncbi:hypothetical protein [Microcystis aeruginosa]|uniref:hypothetical protein n=1 Tax=Microcystis aeruginosa TaxID=1126 RepID=UPI000AAED522|nr:hypothetical protein [Microcystis aeruginosa]